MANYTLVVPTGGIPRWWDGRISHQTQVGFVKPVVQSGAVRTITDTGQDGMGIKEQLAIVRGTVAFHVTSYVGWGSSTPPSVENLRYRIILHEPGSDGSGVRTTLSGVLEGAQTISWDSTTIPDGTYAVSVELLGGGVDDATAIDRYKSIPVTIIVDNTPGVITDEQWLPVIGYIGIRGRWAESFAVDWVRSTETPLSPTARPYPYEFVSPPQTDEDHQALVGDDTFFAEPWLQVWNNRYDQEGRLSQTEEGHRFIVGYDEWLSDNSSSVWAYRFPFTDGHRNQASVNKRTAFRADPTGPGFIGISYEGRLFRLNPTEGVTTLAGIVTRSDIVPYTPFDATVTTQDRKDNQWDIVGSFDQDVLFNLPEDLAINLNNPSIIYVADTGNHVIRKVDLSETETVVTTFAGAIGISGSADGTATDARFNSPWSLEIIDEKLYVTDRNNNALRAIDLATGEVTTITSQLTTPMWIRQFSNGDLAIMDEATYNTGGVIKRINPVSGTVINTIINSPRAYTFDVDWRGNVGPVDNIIAAGNYTPGDMDDHAVSRITPDGEFSMVAYDWGTIRYNNEDGGLVSSADFGTYPISVAIDDDESRIITTGQYQWGVFIYRPATPDDLIQDDIDLDIADRGRDHYHAGTIREFYPNDTRPSLAALHGRHGHNYIGQLNFDDIIDLTDAAIAEYIQSGMGGGIARPELTGRDLAAMIYYIRLQSLQGKTEIINSNEIAQNLSLVGHWDNIEDTTAPVINNDVSVFQIDDTTYQVSFTTDKLTVAVIHYGRTTNYGLNSMISQSSTSHAITLNNLDSGNISDLRFQVRVKDQAGNQAITTDALLLDELVDSVSISVTVGKQNLDNCLKTVILQNKGINAARLITNVNLKTPTLLLNHSDVSIYLDVISFSTVTTNPDINTRINVAINVGLLHLNTSNPEFNLHIGETIGFDCKETEIVFNRVTWAYYYAHHLGIGRNNSHKSGGYVSAITVCNQHLIKKTPATSGGF